jgi:hypothetical protein
VRVDTRPRKRNAPRPAEKSAPGFLQWVRGRACCLLSRGGCGGKIEAAHVDYAGDKGMGTKVADRHVVPLCAFHHAEQHRIGWKSFEAKYSGLNALTTADFLWRHWPGLPLWERKQANG